MTDVSPNQAKLTGWYNFLLPNLKSLGVSRYSVQAAVVILFAILYRFPTFTVLHLGFDEGAYFTFGWELLNGSKLYADLWDIKPPLVFVTFAAMIKLFGGSIVLYRLTASLLIALAGLGVNRLFRLIADPPRWSEFIPSIILIVAFSHLEGIEFNCEVILAPLAAWGIVWIIEGLKFNSQPKILLAGLLFAYGAFVKQVIIFDAMLAFVLILASYASTGYKRVVRNIGLLALPFFVVTLAVQIWLLNEGIYGDFVAAAFTPLQGKILYSGTWTNSVRGKFILDHYPVQLMMFAVPVVLHCLLKGRSPILLAWMFFSTIGVIGVGGISLHYFLPLVLPLSIIYSQLFVLLYRRSRILAGVIIGMFVAQPLFNPQLGNAYLGSNKEYRTVVALVRESCSGNNQTSYVLHNFQGLYFHSRTRCPGKLCLPIHGAGFPARSPLYQAVKEHFKDTVISRRPCAIILRSNSEAAIGFTGSTSTAEIFRADYELRGEGAGVQVYSLKNGTVANDTRLKSEERDPEQRR